MYLVGRIFSRSVFCIRVDNLSCLVFAYLVDRHVYSVAHSVCRILYLRMCIVVSFIRVFRLCSRIHSVAWRIRVCCLIRPALAYLLSHANVRVLLIAEESTFLCESLISYYFFAPDSVNIADAVSYSAFCRINLLTSLSRRYAFCITYARIRRVNLSRRCRGKRESIMKICRNCSLSSRRHALVQRRTTTEAIEPANAEVCLRDLYGCRIEH